MSLPSIDMNGIHPNGKNHDFEKTYPGCLGRMVNLFELNLGVSANKLLTDNPHRDGSPLSRSRSDVSRMSQSPDQAQDEVAVPEFKKSSSSRKSNATPMKMLIAQEMSNDLDSRQNPPNVVAKLMGLDTLPQQESESATKRSHGRGHPRSQSDIPMGYWEKQNDFFHSLEPNEYRDVGEIRHQSQSSPRKRRCDEINRKMALVRQNFDEAKRLSMDVKLRQSKKFHDALDVLNSNKDLFIQCLQEPNKILAERLHNLHSTPPPSEAKRITVLRPSKMQENCKSAGAGNKDEKQMKRSASVQLNWSEKIRLGNSPPSTWKDYENPTQPTRIVVLKPSLGKFHDLKAVGTRPSESPRVLLGEDCFGDIDDDDENQESREVAKAITQHMREKLGRHRRDETLISSVFSNGYVGDESSFNKSEIDYEACNLSDTEVVSPVSRHSWDFVNRLGSPFSSSSLSRASYSPESSVCKEAKKRLSERWAMMSSNGTVQEKRHVRKNSSTLGEMLALSEAKKEAMPGEEGSSDEATKKAAMPVEEGIHNEESKDLNSILVGEQRTDEITECMDTSPRNLIRSKSVPVSSTEFGSRLSTDRSVLDKGKPKVPKEEAKERSSKLSFKEKVSSLFLSRSKKHSKDKPLAFDVKQEFESSPGQMRSESVVSNRPNHLSLGVMETPSKASFSNLIGKHCLASIPTSPGENPDQPSPISVLDVPFEEDILLPHYARSNRQGVNLSNALSSNLIGKSPPIGSIARTLPWDDACMDTTASYSARESTTIQRKEEDTEEWFFFVKTLISVSNIQSNMHYASFLDSWYSLESPLDPSLRETYIDLKDKETLHEAKRRQKRSMRKLVFDFVNEVLVEMADRYGPESGRIGNGFNISPLASPSSMILDEVWGRMSVWVSNEAQCVSDDYEDEDGVSIVVARLIRSDLDKSNWIHESKLEADNFRKEIEVELLEELVDETVAELTGRM